VPKKGQCPVCNAFYGGNQADKERMQVESDKHKQCEKESLSAKHLDKGLAASDSSFRECCIRRMLTITKFITRENWQCIISQCMTATVMDIVLCETKQEGRRGSIEIASCLLKFISSLPTHVWNIATFSDTCSGQNRNICVVNNCRGERGRSCRTRGFDIS